MEGFFWPFIIHLYFFNLLALMIEEMSLHEVVPNF
jgi:hypothetical protein